jgi:translation elongation factor EF-4
LTPQ